MSVIVALLAMLFFGAPAESRTLIGKVTDSTTHSAIAGARVSLTGDLAKKVEITDVGGAFTLTLNDFVTPETPVRLLVRVAG